MARIRKNFFFRFINNINTFCIFVLFGPKKSRPQARRLLGMKEKGQVLFLLVRTKLLAQTSFLFVIVARTQLKFIKSSC